MLHQLKNTEIPVHGYLYAKRINYKMVFLYWKERKNIN
jgi:hypothetical protein